MILEEVLVNRIDKNLVTSDSLSQYCSQIYSTGPMAVVYPNIQVVRELGLLVTRSCTITVSCTLSDVAQDNKEHSQDRSKVAMRLVLTIVVQYKGYR